MDVFESNWKKLIRPNQLDIKHDEHNDLNAKVVIQPLERGFGLTLGNALRRILMSSIQGAAVTGIKIDGVVHEFSTIPGVLEDVTEIILNLKQLSIDYKGDGSKRLLLEKSEPGVVTAADIQLSGDITIANPDLVICTLTEGTSIRMELTIDTGKGYVAADKNRDEDNQIGRIAVDSLFSPIKKVTYKVEDTREGQVLDYDRLVMEVETDGTITAEDALAYSARIMQDQLSVFINFEDPEDDNKQEEEQTLPFPYALLRKVEELELSVRSANCLKNDNIVYIGDLIQKSENDMLRTPNFGRKSLNEIKEIIAQLGLGLGKKYEGWPPENIDELVRKYGDHH